MLLLSSMALTTGPDPVDWAMVAKIREEGLQRSQVMDRVSYMADVLGARLTLSEDMARAQRWVQGEMGRVGLVNVAAEPFMDFGVTWDNEYVSLHMLAPDYQPMVGYPVAHTPGTDGKQVVDAVIADPQVRQDLAALRGTLRGKAVLATPPATINLAALAAGVPRRTEEELRELERVVIAPTRPSASRVPRNPDLLSAADKMAFYKAEGVAAVLQSESGWLGAVRGFSRPGSRNDGWSLAGNLAAPPIIAITPEHYNRMHRILTRGIPVRVELEVRNRMGERTGQAVNIVGEIPGSDLKDEVVMIGAHFDTWHASPNASDNTSGVAVVLEAARILKAVGAKPRRTIRIALWSGEEQGLFGSRAYVRQHFGDPRDPAIGTRPGYQKLSAYFNQDYGAGQYRGIYLQGNEHARTLLTAWMEPFRDMGMTMVSNQSLGSTDHVAFDEVGLPGFQFLQDRIPGTGGHTNLDFFDTLQADDLMKNAVIMASYAYHAAMSDARMPRKILR
ncbi:MAG: M20/M25/M40 family metallo-hydrolase [Gemmatimonadales bacterium]|nr:M20/M25/M40 family metallo-hydrolase [Gemmatimonadales bacterium]MDZ4389604.1 M20/M25/M40 family metallo-hydrolase [Gemmatimonadales bacterium]